MVIKALNLALYLLLFVYITVTAQDRSDVKFGKISPADFVLPKTLSDSNANAMIIADIGRSEFEGNYNGWFNLIFTHYKRIKIINKNGFGAANISIPLYRSNNKEEKLEKLKAVTYNLEDGKVVETKLEASSVFKDVIDKNYVLQKFTFPAVKEGSIIEFSYTINSDFFFNLQSWQFQGEYPCYWSEYEVNIPEFFNFVVLSQGYRPFHIKDAKNNYKSFNIRYEGENQHTESFSASGNVTTTRWVMKDVIPLKEENYTSTLRNHVSKIEFQLSNIRIPNMPVRDFMGNWVKVNESMMKDEDFGAPLMRNNNWMDDDMKAITTSTNDQLSKVKNIYYYVRNNFTCTDYNSLYLSSTLKNTMKSHNGKVADINLLLCAMLKHENIEADPVLLGTRSHGLTNEFYPIMNRFNYVICQVKINGKIFYLDASHADLGFGKLTKECYNGHARVMGTEPHPVYFYPDSLMERKITSVSIINDEKEGGLAGNYQTTPGYYESLNIRQKIKEKGEGAYFKTIKSSTDEGMEMKNEGVDSLKSLEDPIKLHYEFKMDIAGDIIYFTPLIREGYKENPFKSADRQYPVEMPSVFDDVYILNMEIPKGYEVEELPRSAKISLNDYREGYFEYIIAKDEDRVQLRSRVTFTRATFMPEEYESLREFFNYVVKKHNEQIVFRKKKS